MWWLAQWTKQSRSGSVDNESRIRAEDVLARSDRQKLPKQPVIMCNYLIKTQWNLNAYTTTTNFSEKFSTNVMLLDIFNEEWNQCFYVAISVKMKGDVLWDFKPQKAKASVGYPSQKNTACFSLSNLKHQEHIVNSIINNLNSFNLTELHLDSLLSIPIVFASFWPHLARKIWRIGDVRIVFCDKFHLKYITPARIVCQHVQLFQHLMILFPANNKKTLVTTTFLMRAI